MRFDKWLLFVVVFGLFPQASAQYVLASAESPTGFLGADTGAYRGVRTYEISGSSITPGPAISPSLLNDPFGVKFSAGTLYVSNRHGNSTGLGSIQAFSWTGTGFSGGETILSSVNPLFSGTHGFNFSPSGELFTATLAGGTRRYSKSLSGWQDTGGTAVAATRDAWISTDGARLYETIPQGLRITNLGDWTSSFYPLDGNDAQQMAFRGGKLYVATYASTGSVYEITLGADFLPSGGPNLIATVPGATGLAFSPDGLEMLVSGHTTNKISRFKLSGTEWLGIGQIDTSENLGFLATAPVPEPGSFAVLGLGLAALARKRRKN